MFNYGEDMMKQWSENWEKMMGASLEKMVKNDKFVQEMSRAIAATMTGKAQYARLVDEQLAAMNLPSRTDMVKALQKLTDLEERMVTLQETIEDWRDEYRQNIAAVSAELAGKADLKKSVVKDEKPAVKEKVAKKKVPAVKKPVATKKAVEPKAKALKKTTRKA